MSIFDDHIPNKTLIQTYVFYSPEQSHNPNIVKPEDKAFYVSTIDRTSSSMYGGRYAETIVWEWDSTTKQRGDIIHMGEGGEGSIRTHFSICEKLYKDGTMQIEEEEE